MRNSRIPFQWLRASLALLLVILQSHLMAAEASGVGDYDPCSELGPQHWGDLHEAWETCKTGEQQSPISIKPSNIIDSPSLGSLRTNYDTRPAFLQEPRARCMPPPPHVLALTVLNPTFSVMFHARQVNWTESPGKSCDRREDIPSPAVPLALAVGARTLRKKGSNCKAYCYL
ncbi:hypothetical protein BHM03_00055067 [Ensete ventricosum]|nr:hypothetical protein BHM03_00055067 [Ensete ventricosum]